ncbi:uncharacterized protein LOC117169704 [Belonocnema kinseyi]|uniref:uncharacterized protein LOC117169704 n=1 Tax=Belonocnema kinseyi TaxID=2817044 RepID=UPI00143D19CC|nr:uncharacterized protein LOC117169704 [Belonocnema kinseyi]
MLSSMIDAKFKILQDKVKGILSMQKNVILIADICTESMTTKNFVGITVRLDFRPISTYSVQVPVRPLDQATKEVCAEKSVTLSKCIPLVTLLLQTVEEYQPCHAAAFKFKEQLLTELEKRFGNLENLKLAAMATLLDPRFKKIPFWSALSVPVAVQEIGNNLSLGKEVKFKIKVESNASNVMVEETAPTIPSVTPTKRNYIWVRFANMAHEKQPGTNNDNAGRFPLEITQYLTRAVSSRTVNPVDECNDMKPHYPHLYEVAMEDLPILAKSVPSERVFSKTGVIMTKLRNRLLGKRLNQLLFLSSVSKALWFEQ